MPSPKSGTAGSAVSPADPGTAKEADKADPGQVDQVKAEQRQNQTGKYGSVTVKPFKPPQKNEKKKKTSWIELELIGEDKKPIPGERYRVTLPDGSVAEGSLDEKGLARVEGFEPGTCKISFPDLDQEAWEDA